jgi:hypothetical protein
MKEIIVNTYIDKGGKSERKNFNIRSNSLDELVLKPLILEKLSIDNKWQLERENFEFISKENVVIYKLIYKLK